MKRGRKLAYGKMDLERLLQAASKKAVKSQPDSFTKEERKQKWLGHPPASNEAIAAAETRLKAKLPLIFNFLRISNGFSAFSITGVPALLGIEELITQNSVDSALINILKDSYP